MSGHRHQPHLPDDLIGKLAGCVLVVASWKGGVGKTTLAIELAHLLRAVLLDADPDLGGASRGLGYRHERYKTAPLLDALERGTTPRATRRRHQVDLVPSHPDLAVNQPTPDTFATAVESWAEAWHRPVVVDTPPGGWATTRGACSAAHVIVAPALLSAGALDGLQAQVDELDGYPVTVVPNMVPRAPAETMLSRLERIVDRSGVAVASQIDQQTWLTRRVQRGPVTAKPPTARSQTYVTQVNTTAGEVAHHALSAA